LSGRPVAANKPEAERQAKPCPCQDSRQLQGRGCEPVLARTHGSGTSVGNSVSAQSVPPRSSCLIHDDKDGRPAASRRPKRSAAAAWKGMADRPYLSMTIALIGIPRVTPVSVAQDGATHNRAQHGRSYPARRRGAGQAPAERRSKHRRKTPPSTRFVDGKRRSALRVLARWTSHAARRRRRPSNTTGSTDSINLRRAGALLAERPLGGGAAEVGIGARGTPAARVAPVLQKPRPAGRGTCPLKRLRARLLVLRRPHALRLPHCSTQRPSLPRARAHATSRAANPCPPPVAPPRWQSAPS